MYNKKGFTFVELIVVITIMAILSTIGFTVYQSYLSGGRDSNRIIQLNDIYDGLEILGTQVKLPFPNNMIDFSASGTIFAYQGDVGENVIRTIGYDGGGNDPGFNIPFTYMLSSNLKDFQLLTYINDFNLLDSVNVKQTDAASIVYGNMFPKVKGLPLGISIEKDTKIPLHRTGLPINNIYDIIINTGSILMYKRDKEFIDSDRDDVIHLSNASSCLRIQELGRSKGNGNYVIELNDGRKKTVYCDMEFAGGGWTLVGRSHPSAVAGNFGWMKEYGSIDNDNDKYSLGESITSLNFGQIMVSSYKSGKSPDKAIVVDVIKNYIRTPTSYNWISIPSNCQEFSSDGKDWNSSCDLEKLGSPFSHNYWGNITYRSDESKSGFREEGFFFRSQSAPTPTSQVGNLYGLRVNNFVTDYLGDINNKPGMIFVR